MESEIHVMPCIYSEVKKGQESVTPMNFVLESFSSYLQQAAHHISSCIP